ncbi:MAG: glycosyltransferase family 2 protein [candidate division FCPU426 bacterium]
MTASPRVSVAVVNWNTRDLLLKCLASLRAESSFLPLEIIVVDNGSSDGSPEAVRAQYPEVLLLTNPASVGFAAGTNQALRRATAPFWAFVAPDAELKPRALLTLVGELQARPELMAVGPKLLNSDGSLQPSGRRFPAPGRFFLEDLLPGCLKRTAWWQRRVFGRLDFDRPALVDEVSGACLVARREAFERVGLLDEQFFIYYEEVDWFKRLAATGGRVGYVPSAEVFHHWGAGMAQMKGEGVLINFRSAFKYWRKHRGIRGEGLARAAVAAHAVGWSLGRLALTVVFRKPWRELPARLGLYAQVLALALGMKK